MEHLRVKTQPLIKGLRTLPERFFADFTILGQTKEVLSFEETQRMTDLHYQNYLHEYTSSSAFKVEDAINRLAELGVDVKDLLANRSSARQITFDHLATLLEQKVEPKKP